VTAFAVRRTFAAFGFALVLLGAGTTLTQDRSGVANPYPSDFEINWIAARRLVDGETLYDRAAARAQSVATIGSRVGTAYTHTFTSYVGTPVVALVHVPLLALGFEAARDANRVATILGMLVALALVVAACSAGSRVTVMLVGLGALLLSAPALRALELGQAQGLVMLGLALGVWGIAREHDALAGVGLGLAVAVKLSPVLLVLYLALRGRWRAVRWSATTTATLTALAAALGRPADFVVWVRRIVPTVAGGTRVIWNQSLPAWLARMFAPVRDVSTYQPIGSWHYFGIVVALGATVGLWLMRRRPREHAIDPLDLGILVLVALLAGPLSWDHYFVWAVIPLVLVCDPSRWIGVTRRETVVLVAALGIGTLLLYVPTNATWVLTLNPDAISQIRSGPYTLAVLVYLAVALRILGRKPATSAVPVRARAENGIDPVHPESTDAVDFGQRVRLVVQDDGDRVTARVRELDGRALDARDRQRL
jgi:alpha-1,2-mannosyltransferase